MSVLPAAALDADSVLVSGPPMSGKYDLFNRLLAAWSDAPIVVSTGRPVGTVRSDYERITDGCADDVVVIDCATYQQGDRPDDTPTTRYVSSAGDLTEIGIEFTDVVESSNGVSRAVGVYSLSELLMYWEPERIYRFTRVMESQSSGQNWPFVGVLGSTTHDEEAVNTLYEPFEAVVETRIEGDGRQFRVRDRTGAPSGWTTF
jgi:hypothetical protein